MIFGWFFFFGIWVEEILGVCFCYIEEGGVCICLIIFLCWLFCFDFGSCFEGGWEIMVSEKNFFLFDIEVGFLLFLICN